MTMPAVMLQLIENVRIILVRICLKCLWYDMLQVVLPRAIYKRQVNKRTATLGDDVDTYLEERMKIKQANNHYQEV